MQPVFSVCLSNASERATVFFILFVQNYFNINCGYLWPWVDHYDIIGGGECFCCSCGWGRVPGVAVIVDCGPSRGASLAFTPSPTALTLAIAGAHTRECGYFCLLALVVALPISVAATPSPTGVLFARQKEKHCVGVVLALLTGLKPLLGSSHLLAEAKWSAQANIAQLLGPLTGLKPFLGLSHLRAVAKWLALLMLLGC